MGPGGREVTREEFDDSAVLFLFECVAEHLPVFRQIVGFVLGSTCLVSAADFCDFSGYEFLGGRSVEVAVECGAVGDSG